MKNLVFPKENQCFSFRKLEGYQGRYEGFSGHLICQVSGNLWRELRGAERSEAPRIGSSFY